MATFVLVHGSWLGGWCWRDVVPPLSAAGHRVLTPTLTGLGERAHLGGREVDLDLHVRDIAAVIQWEGLGQDPADLVLVGHSYAGMVITAAADRLGEGIGHLVYLDAVVPEDGKSVFDLIPPEMAASVRATAEDDGTGIRFPPAPPEAFGIIDPEAAAWVSARSVAMPLKTHEQPIRLGDGHRQVRRNSYIACTDPALEGLGRFAEAARARGWNQYQIATGHDPMITRPVELAGLLSALAEV